MSIAFSHNLYMYIFCQVYVFAFSLISCRLYARLYLDFCFCVFALNMVMSLYFIFTLSMLIFGQCCSILLYRDVSSCNALQRVLLCRYVNVLNSLTP